MKNFRSFLLLTFFLVAVSAFADEDVTIFGAVQHEGKLTLQSAQSTATTTGNFNPSNFGVFGARFSHGKIFGGEHTFAYASDFLGGGAKAFIYNSDFMLQAPLPRIRPYAVAGLGTIITWGSNSAGQPDLSKIGTKFALNYGGGLKIFPAGPVGVRFDIRGYAIPSASFNLPAALNAGNQSIIATVKSQSQTLNLLEVG
ncbi:MAG TPA: outer membrane beta-barrel protein, partial [Terriglobia bacterium]